MPVEKVNVFNLENGIGFDDVLYSEGLTPEDVEVLSSENPFYLYVAIIQTNKTSRTFFGSAPRHEIFLKGIIKNAIPSDEHPILTSFAQADFISRQNRMISRITLHQKPGLTEPDSQTAIYNSLQTIDHSLLDPKGVYINFQMRPYLIYDTKTRKLSTSGRT